MGFLNALLQGIIQGLTEFLPVSSSGHISLYQHVSGTSGSGSQAFGIFLHFGTLIAVFVVYRQLIWDLILEFVQMVKDLFAKKFSWKLEDMNDNRRMVIMLVVASACAILLFIPLLGFTGLVDAAGETVNDIEDLSGYFSEDSSILAEGIFLLMTGGLLIYATLLSNKRKGSTSLTYKNAFAMGIGQCFATMPGLSRSGTTTTLGMITGAEKNTALNFSFIMSIPAVLAANVLELTDIGEMEINFTVFEVIVGVVVSALVGIAAIVGLKWIVSNDKLHYFGYYCLAMGLAVVVVAIIEHSTGTNIFTGEALNAAQSLAPSGDLVSITDISASDILSGTDLSLSDLSLSDIAA